MDLPKAVQTRQRIAENFWRNCSEQGGNGKDFISASDLKDLFSRTAVKGNLAVPIYTKAVPNEIISVGNWNLSSSEEGELSIINSDGQQQV